MPVSNTCLIVLIIVVVSVWNVYLISSTILRDQNPAFDSGTLPVKDVNRLDEVSEEEQQREIEYLVEQRLRQRIRELPRVQPRKESPETNYYYTNYFDPLPPYFAITAKSVIDLYGELHVYTNIEQEFTMENVYFHIIEPNQYLPFHTSCDKYHLSDIMRFTVATGVVYDNYYFFDMDILHFHKIEHCNWLSTYTDGHSDFCISPAAFCFKRDHEFLKNIIYEVEQQIEPNGERVQFGPALITEAFHKYQPKGLSMFPISYYTAKSQTFEVCYSNFFHPANIQKNSEYLTAVYNVCKSFLGKKRDYVGAQECFLVEDSL